MNEQGSCGAGGGWRSVLVRCIGAFYVVIAGMRIAVSLTTPEKYALDSSRVDIMMFGLLTALAFVVGFGLMRMSRWSLYFLVIYFSLDVASYVIRHASPIHPWILTELLFVLCVVFSPLGSTGIRKA
jgi:hypothetical protein